MAFLELPEASHAVRRNAMRVDPLVHIDITYPKILADLSYRLPAIFHLVHA